MALSENGILATAMNSEVRKFLVASITSGVAGIVPVIAAEWFLIGKLGVDLLFGMVLLGLGVLSLVISFASGAIIDGFSRKGILVSLHAGSAVFMALLFIAWHFFSGFIEWELVAVMIVDEVYNGILWSSITAFAAEITSNDNYGNINSLVEMQGQLSPVIAGVLAALMVSRISVGEIFILSSIGYAIGAYGFLIIRTPAKTKHWKFSGKSYTKETRDGINYLLKKRHLLYLLILSSVPFIGIKIGNYIKPIYVLQGLHGAPWVLGASESAYAVAAIVASLFIPAVMLRFGKMRTLLASMAVYAVGSFFMMLVPMVSIYLLLQTTHGFGNPGSRIVRKTITMESVENGMLGRVSAFIGTATTAAMLLILLLYIYVVSSFGPFVAMGTQSLLVAGAAAGLIVNERRNGRKSDPDRVEAIAT